MEFVFLLVCALVGLLILTYLESPEFGEKRMINHLVKESKRNKRRSEHSPKRGYSYVCAGWSANRD